MIVFAVWLVLAGALAVLAGLSGRARVQRLRRHGQTAWAVTVPPPVSGAGQAGALRRVRVQYRLADGRVLERIAPAAAIRSALLRPGQKILVWYDGEDPDNFLVYGRWGRAADWAFVVAGVFLVATGLFLTVR